MMNKSELIDAVALSADLSKSSAGRAVDAVLDAVMTSLKNGETLSLTGFGSFYTTQREARAGRNPRTGQAVEIKAAKLPKFRAGKFLKDAVQ